MNDTFTVKVNENFNFNIATATAQNLNAVSLSDNEFHILHNGQSVQAEIISTDFNAKKYTVKVNNNIYVVSIADALDQLIKKMGFDVSSNKVANNVKAPMPGLLLDIMVESGQEVTENQPLLILEAMKMENSIVSPRGGIIKSILAKKGAAVEKGELLIEFE
ncbi:acetyl-CoA carboxylase biotin carboxyl carrier protein subunit [Flavobacterium sp.]|uniref:acetyl-CoA carboxylase biotin carboxyl carrier protein subunit n=1 Tax=Flavobacterium sp. TaxID=239 RepID=UPI003529386D